MSLGDTVNKAFSHIKAPARHTIDIATAAALIGLVAACSGGKSPTGGGGNGGGNVTPVLTINSANVTPQIPFVGDSAALYVSATASNGATGPDSIRALGKTENGGTFKGRFIAKDGNQSIPITVYGTRPDGTVLQKTTNATYTGVQASEVHITTETLWKSPAGRATVEIDGKGYNVPADTTVRVAQGTHEFSITPSSSDWKFGSMTVNNKWTPIATNIPAQTATLGNNATIDIKLLSKNDMQGDSLTQLKNVWEDQKGYLHPTQKKIVVAELYQHPQGVYAQNCQDATQTDIDGFKAWVQEAAKEDSAGTFGPRRKFITRIGDPEKDGALVQKGTAWVPNQSSRDTTYVVACRQVPEAQSNGTYYDSNGFLDGYVFQSGGDKASWMSEGMGYVDMVFDGQEATTPITRDARTPLTVYRTTYGDDVWEVMGVAWKAGQKGYGLIKGPQ